MARLNEPPIAPAPAPATESIDAVKRRFVRQNREFAKINAEQNVLISSLRVNELRLIGENQSLRAHIIHLENALETQTKRPSFDNIDAVKQQLEAKLQEFRALVSGLGDLNKQSADSPPSRAKLAPRKKTAEEREWRGWLNEVKKVVPPTISEDKSYSRRTMNAEEMQNFLNMADSQSPDIGPPPVSRIASDEAIAFDPCADIGEKESAELMEDDESAIPANLETRRKRRESGPKPTSRRAATFDSTPGEETEGTTKTVRAGAKRKFSVQEDEDKAHTSAESFRYSRRNATSADDANPEEQARPSSPGRLVLGNKPVNTDPVLSPKKQRSSATEKSDKPEKKPLSKPNRGRLTSTRKVVPDLPILEMPPSVEVAEIKLESLPPKTPAAEPANSPPTTEPSTSRPEPLKDTPPPGDLSTDGQMGTSARPSRRSRPQVSYKEPSLNTKMRRPGKELLDAVIPDNRRHSMDSHTDPLTVGRTSTKHEPNDSEWKSSVSATAERIGEEGFGVGSPLRQKLDRKESIQDAKPDVPKLNSAAASQAISALIDQTSTSKRRLPNPLPVLSWKPESKKADLTKKEDDLAIFDFTETSPPSSNTTGEDASAAHPRSQIDLAKAARAARRHSSVSTVGGSEERKIDSIVKAENNGYVDGTIQVAHKRTVSGSMRSSSVVAPRASAKERERIRERKGLAPPADGRVLGKDDRAGSRRKSMLI